MAFKYRPEGKVIMRNYGSDCDQEINRFEHEAIPPRKASERETIVIGGEEWNEILLRGKVVDEVVIVYDEIPLSASAKSLKSMASPSPGPPREDQGETPAIPETRCIAWGDCLKNGVPLGQERVMREMCSIFEREERIAKAVLYSHSLGGTSEQTGPSVSLETYCKTLRSDAPEFDLITVETYDEFRWHGKHLRNLMAHMPEDDRRYVPGISCIRHPSNPCADSKEQYRRP
jgi:hypothetical protein